MSDRSGESRRRESDAPLGIVRMLMSFLDRNLGRFSPGVQNIIGLGILLVFIVYVLNGFVAPTFIRGSLFIRESAAAGKKPAPGYQVVGRDEETLTNQWGRWMLPVYRSGIPGPIKIQVYGPDRTYIDQRWFYGPWPVWSSVVPFEYDIEVRPFEPEGKRLVVYTTRPMNLGERIRDFVAARVGARAAHAQQARPAIPPPTRAPAVQRPLATPRGEVPRFEPETAIPPTLPPPTAPSAERRPPQDRAVEGVNPGPSTQWAQFSSIYGIEIVSLRAGPGAATFIAKLLLGSTGRVYFGVAVNGTELADVDLLSDPDVQCSGLSCLKLPAPDEGGSAGLLRFPVKSVRESWLPVRVNSVERLEGIFANLTRAVTFTTNAPKTRENPFAFNVVPKGRVELNVYWAPERMIGSVDLTEALKKTGERQVLADRNDALMVEIRPVAAWVGARPRF